VQAASQSLCQARSKRCGVVAAAARMCVHSINVFIARVSVDRSVTSFGAFLTSECELHKCMIPFLFHANCMLWKKIILEFNELNYVMITFNLTIIANTN
jgi:hypothetical protein